MSLLLLLFCSVAQAGQAAPTDSPQGYAHSLPLEISGQQGVVRVALPVSVYQLSATDDLRDLRVFDSQGAPQRYAFDEPSVVEAEQTRELSATVFPVYATKENPPSSLQLDIQTGSGGNLLSVRTRGEVPETLQVLDSLVLDFGTETQNSQETLPAIRSLRFELPEGPANYDARVWLEVSSDLKSWNSIGVSQLRWMENREQKQLISNELSFIMQRFRYARVTWQEGTPVVFKSIVATAVQRTRVEPAWTSLWLSPKPGKFEGDLVYDAHIAIPVEHISLRFEQDNVIFPATLGTYLEVPSRKGRGTEWTFAPHSSFTAYKIAQSGSLRESGPLALHAGHASKWVLRPQKPAPGVSPKLGLFWKPITLIFLAGGTPPYRLAFGRADAQRFASSLPDVAPGFVSQDFETMEWAKLGVLESGTVPTVSSESTAQKAVEAANTRRWALWGVLLSSVAVLSLLTLRLMRQMKEPSPPES